MIAGTVSCNIKDDVSNCPGSIILDYSAYSAEILDEIEADEQIDVFVFDTSGICVEVYSFSYGELKEKGFEFEVPITYRNYNAVVWQGLNSDGYTSRRMVLGESYENFYLRLVYESASQSCSDMVDPLWASPFEPIDFCAKITRHRVYMTRLHTDVDLYIQQKMKDGSLVDLNMEDYLVTIEATNNVYHTDYTIDETQSVEIEYNNAEEIVDGEDMSCGCVGTLRLTPDMDCTMYVESLSSPQRIISVGGNTEIDLVEYMLATKTDSTLSDQEFLDRNKVWEIYLLVEEQDDDTGYVAINININGWVVWFSSNDLN